ncbi:cobalt-precorrin-5B (C(1))-methyltransferase [Alicyclobacillaceae bacterium I2511]|nr:cobalt-precorrin-5B (C(1))-methyltransferase [Alicyclobacillaceae bacterium I2511]
MGEMLEVPQGPLRHGYTTGACATACTKGALLSLITQHPVQTVEIVLPMGDTVAFALHGLQVALNTAQAATLKDGGDDPDATHGATILAQVSWQEEAGVWIDGGVGVGRVTKPGLPVPVGMAAINPVPRRMIAGVVAEVLAAYGIQRGVRVVIAVPDGVAIAKKTLNGRLGILGGISILGTRGTVVPFSTASYKASIVQGLKVASVQGVHTAVLTTGGRSERYAMQMFSDLPEESFIEMGEFVGFAAKNAKRLGFTDLRLVGMMGKFSKIAQGIMMVHSHSAPVDFSFLAQLAGEVGVPPVLQAQILTANTASQVGDWLVEWGYREFFNRVCWHICQQVRHEIGGGLRVETRLTTLSGELLGGAVLNG